MLLVPLQPWGQTVVASSITPISTRVYASCTQQQHKPRGRVAAQKPWHHGCTCASQALKTLRITFTYNFCGCWISKMECSCDIGCAIATSTNTIVHSYIKSRSTNDISNCSTTTATKYWQANAFMTSLTCVHMLVLTSTGRRSRAGRCCCGWWACRWRWWGGNEWRQRSRPPPILCQSCSWRSTSPDWNIRSIIQKLAMLTLFVTCIWFYSRLRTNRFQDNMWLHAPSYVRQPLRSLQLCYGFPGPNL